MLKQLKFEFCFDALRNSVLVQINIDGLVFEVVF